MLHTAKTAVSSNNTLIYSKYWPDHILFNNNLKSRVSQHYLPSGLRMAYLLLSYFYFIIGSQLNFKFNEYLRQLDAEKDDDDNLYR